MHQQYLVPPGESLEKGLPILYREATSERTVVLLTPSLAEALTKEFEREPTRYSINRMPSLAEVQRAALQVYLRLREENPELFFSLRDSINRTNNNLEEAA